MVPQPEVVPGGATKQGEEFLVQQSIPSRQMVGRPCLQFEAVRSATRMEDSGPDGDVATFCPPFRKTCDASWLSHPGALAERPGGTLVGEEGHESPGAKLASTSAHGFEVMHHAQTDMVPDRGKQPTSQRMPWGAGDAESSGAQAGQDSSQPFPLTVMHRKKEHRAVRFFPWRLGDVFQRGEIESRPAASEKTEYLAQGG